MWLDVIPMKRFAGLIPIMVILAGLLSAARADQSAPDLEQTIAFLLQYVAESDLRFIRNGEEHDPEEAAEHMEAKYKHFRKKIRTPEDFIRLAATKSLLSGEAYRVRTPEGQEMETAVWLTQVLADFRTRAHNLTDEG